MVYVSHVNNTNCVITAPEMVTISGINIETKRGIESGRVITIKGILDDIHFGFHFFP